MDWKTMLAYISGSVDEELLLRNEYLVAENRILRNQIQGRLRLNDGERQTLAEIGKRLGKHALDEVASIMKPETILGWHRRLVAKKFDGSKNRQYPGRPRVDAEIEELVVRLARENKSWGYDTPSPREESSRQGESTAVPSQRAVASVRGKGALPCTWRVAPFLPPGSRMSILTTRGLFAGKTSLHEKRSALLWWIGIAAAAEALSIGIWWFQIDFLDSNATVKLVILSMILGGVAVLAAVALAVQIQEGVWKTTTTAVRGWHIAVCGVLLMFFGPLALLAPIWVLASSRRSAAVDT